MLPTSDVKASIDCTPAVRSLLMNGFLKRISGVQKLRRDSGHGFGRCGECSLLRETLGRRLELHTGVLVRPASALSCGLSKPLLFVFA